MSKIWSTLRTLNVMMKEAERQTDILAETPKSVSGMTRIFGPQIARDFPEVSLQQFSDKVENLLVTAFTAVTEGETKIPEDVSEELRLQIKNQIADNRRQGIHEVYAQIKIHQTEVTNYEKKDGTCVITFQSAVEHYHYKERDGKLIWGERERKQQTKYNTELLYIQDEQLVNGGNAIGTTCPSCGAPIKQLGMMRCEYCGLAVTPVNLKVWKLYRFYEVDYHHV